MAEHSKTEFEKNHPTISKASNFIAKKLFSGAVGGFRWKGIHATDANTHGPNRVPEFTPAESAMLQKANWAAIKVDDKGASLRELLNGVRKGLGIALIMPENAKKCEKLLHDLRCDVFTNQATRDIFKSAKFNDDDSYLFDQLELGKHPERIEAINNLDFNDCNSANDVLKKLQDSIGLITHGTKIIDLKDDCYFGTRREFDNVYLRTVEKPNRFGTKQAEHLFSPKRFKEGQEASQSIAMHATTKTQKDREAAEEHHKAVLGDGSNDGLITRINKTLQDIKRETKPDTSEDAALRTNDRAGELTRNYNELRWHAEEQLKNLEAICDKIGGDGFNHEDVVSAYDRLINEQLKSIDQAIECLQNAGQYEVIDPATSKPAIYQIPEDIFQRAIVTTELLQGKRASLDHIQQQGAQLEAARDALLQKVAFTSGYQVNPRNFSGPAPSPAPGPNPSSPGISLGGS